MIGIIARTYQVEGDLICGCSSAVVEWLQGNDGIAEVIQIPFVPGLDGAFEQLTKTIDKCDGIVIPGYLAAANSNINILSDADKMLATYLYEHDIPTLGICLGCQIMSSAANDLDRVVVSDHKLNQDQAHEVFIEDKSLLFDIVGKKQLLVNSNHLYAIGSTKLEVAARDANNVIESVEAPDKRFFLGVQWHPETLLDESSMRIRKAFIEACIKNER